MEGTIELVRRDVLLSNPGVYGIPDEQLHFPFLYESGKRELVHDIPGGAALRVEVWPRQPCPVYPIEG